MKYDYEFFLRRYKQIESDFLELTDFIGLPSDFNHPSYSFGSSKLMDFCLKVGTEVETFRHACKLREMLVHYQKLFLSINAD